MSSSTSRRFVIVPAREAYEVEHCWQCPNQCTRDRGSGENETVCEHKDVDMPRVADHGIPDWCPIRQETYANNNSA